MLKTEELRAIARLDSLVAIWQKQKTAGRRGLYMIACVLGWCVGAPWCGW